MAKVQCSITRQSALVAITLLAVGCGAADPVSTETPPEQRVTAPASVVAFRVAPRVDTIRAGDSLRFAAAAEWSDRAARNVAVSYSATGGVMAPNGLFTAGTRLGSFLVVASCACASAESSASPPRADTARVVVVAGAPPRQGVEQVPLLLHRMDGGSGDVLVSNGIPLPPGWLVDPAAPPMVRVLVGGVEVPIFAEVLKGKHPDGSVMSLLLQFVWPGDGGRDAILEVGAAAILPARAKTPINGQMAAAAALPIDAEYLVSTQIVGPTVSRFNAPQSPGFFQSYEAEFDRWGENHWATYGANWEALNFYDRALSHFAFWARTGDPVLWERAARIAIDYRNKYLEANNFGTTEWWAQLDGLALHYWLAGDERSREAVYKTADNLHQSRGGAARLTNTTSHEWMDNRNQSKVLSGKILAHRLEAPPYGAVTNWSAQASDDLGWILQTQAANGSFVFNSQCGQSSNFMTGMLTSVLIQYAEQIAPDARILPAVQRFQDWLWDTQWRPAEQVYNYYSGGCPGEGDATPASDLNGFYLEAYGWLYARTGDSKYLQRGDATFAGSVTKTWFNSPKMFNQAFQFSWRYLGYRR
ncbi:MAG: hypothetical protein SFU57_08250 [Gemmatimonadales bacterium]|nr:hypothetical protein [Gemmatimonadales bacterium]